MTKNGNRGKGAERCTFCEKSRHHLDRPLIAGPPGIYICSECVEICTTILKEDERRNSQTSAVGVLAKEEVPTPAEIQAALDSYVIGQETAKKVLSVAVYSHYRRLQARSKPNPEVDLEKSNILLVGPTGSGKTLLAKTLARILDVPFAIADATTLTEAGYVGEDVENILLKLLQAANFDLERAQQGIIYIDEVDKIGRTTQNVSITRDVSGEGEQDRSKRDRLLKHLNQKDLIEFGLIPEFIGRLPVVATLKSLTKDDLVQVMTEPKNAIVKQFEEYFRMDGCELEIPREALEEIAEQVLAQETGVRALRSIIEELLLNVRYNLPNLAAKNPVKVKVTPAAVRREEEPLVMPMPRQKKDDKKGPHDEGLSKGPKERESA